MEEDELECRADSPIAMCAPDAAVPAPPPTTVPATPSPETSALDDAADDLIFGPPLPPYVMPVDEPHPPMLLDEEPEAPHPPLRDLPRTVTPEEQARRDAAWEAQEERDMAREEQAERDREAEQRWRDEQQRRADADHPLLDDAAIERDFSIDDDNGGRGPNGFDLRSQDGGYVYGEATSEGLTGGIGIGHQRDDTLDVDGPGAQFGIGTWRDQDGREYSGIRLNGQVGSITGHSADERNPLSGSLAGGTLDAGVYDDGSTFTIGAQAGLVDAGVTFPLDDYGDGADPGVDTDSSVSLQGGIGPGAALRIHHGDVDGDGVPEAGFGVSAFDVGFDVRSEYLGQAWNWMTGASDERRMMEEVERGRERAPRR